MYAPSQQTKLKKFKYYNGKRERQRKITKRVKVSPGIKSQRSVIWRYIHHHRYHHYFPNCFLSCIVTSKFPYKVIPLRLQV